MTRRLILAAFYLAVIIALVPRCGIYAEANVTAGSPVYAELRGATVIAWGYAVNLGTATAENCILTLTVLEQKSRRPVEVHEQALGNLAAGAKVKFEVVLEAVRFGDPVDSRVSFRWD